jgi:hypothetical protein
MIRSRLSTDILIPNKLKTLVYNHIAVKDLKTISPDIEYARQLLLLTASYLVFDTEDGKRLHHRILRDNLGRNYMNVFKVLAKGTSKKGAVIETIRDYCPGYSRRYKLTNTYTKGFHKYTITHERITEKLEARYVMLLRNVKESAIATGIVRSMEFMVLPTEDEVIAHGKALAKNKHKTGKGKTLTFRGNNSKDIYKDPKNRSFVMDDVRMFMLYTTGGVILPKVGDAKSGGRVSHTFNLIPSWIRKMVKIVDRDGVLHELEELDFSSLHPNLANSIYGGSGMNHNHDTVSEYLGISRQEAKIAHLSFFNHKLHVMRKSVLYSYYMEKEPYMMMRLECEKDMSEFGHKATSRALFKAEVAIMNDVCSYMNERGIVYNYIYDAIAVSHIYMEEMTEVMNNVAKKHRVNTSV